MILTITLEEPTVKVAPSLESSHGWPSDLFLVRFPDGRYAFNGADTKGLDPVPMDFRGLAVHRSTASVDAYREAHPALPEGGKAHPTPYAEARKIAEEKDVDALLLFDGSKIADVEYLR